ncbi:hypothetical protein ACFQ0K_08385 [Nocardioides caeni]|uniref:EI24 domain-containing protein n=1 Tax=Nocardioides caeni TaxID=574700 RepID=A0A4S8N2H9_9ACTN|nr:hypothetical protein [Nocardioides caeni]THV10138.1 hypothetical protein E9934_15145 [Nocardioides caeni]
MSNYQPPTPPPPGGGGGYGAPPPAGPPGGGYGGPPQGGGYGGPPPGGPYGGGYGGQPSAPYSIGNAFNYGWTKFQANVGPIILAVLAIVLSVVVIYAIMWFGLFAAASSGGDGGFILALVFGALMMFVIWAVVYVIGAGIVRAALDITYGRQVEVGTIFKFDNIGQLLLAGLLVGIMTAVGTILCYIPGLIVGFFTQFTLFFLIDKNMPAIEAIKASFAFVNKNLGSLIGFYIAGAIAIFIGSLLCGIGALVAIPVVVIGAAYTYRTLQGEPVAP